MSQVVERWCQHSRRRIDLWGYLDLMAVHAPCSAPVRSMPGETTTAIDPSAPASPESHGGSDTEQFGPDDPFPTLDPETPGDGEPVPAIGTLRQVMGLTTCIAGLQVTSASAMSSRRKKMLSLPDQVEPFIRAGGVVLLMGWKKQGHRWLWAAERFAIGVDGLEVGARTAWMTPPRMAGG